MEKGVILKIFILISMLFVSLFSEQTSYTKTALEKRTDELRSIDDNRTSTTTKTYTSSSTSEDPKNWNTSNWNDYSKKNGVNTGSIGKMQSFWGTEPGENINTVNSNSLLENNADVDNNLKGLRVWSTESEKDLKGSTSNTYAKTSMGKVTKCFIARDLPVRYKCSYSGLTFGGQMNTDGQSALKVCENNCLAPSICIEVEKAVNTTQLIDDVSTNKQDDIKETKATIENPLIIKNISFIVGTSAKRSAKLKIFVSIEKKESLIADIYINDDSNVSIPLGYTADNISFVLEQIGEAQSYVKNIQVIFKEQGKFICPILQDISKKNPGNFAFICPSGRIKDYNFNGNTYKICEDYGMQGRNKDGTFSDYDSCSNVCKIQHPCENDITTYNVDVLKQFREGCIMGQDDCAIDTCTILRKTGVKILNETVFNATNVPVQTISSTYRVEGTIRPKPLASTDVEFQEKTAEEYKEIAYGKMMTDKTYKLTTMAIQDNTESDSKFSIDISDGVSAQENSSLYWVYKPEAYQVNTDLQKYYMIIEALFERTAIASNGEIEKVKNRVLYAKTAELDSFKPFAVKKDAVRATPDENGISQNVESITAFWEYKTFSSNRWYFISPSSTLEYFKQSLIIMDFPVLRISAIENMSNIHGGLEGMLKSRTYNGPIETKHYDGNRAGTGEILASYKVYAFVTSSSESISYQELTEQIENKEIFPFYDAVSEFKINSAITDDTGQLANNQGKDHSIAIYLYGLSGKKTSFAQIFPKQKHINKRGYIYVFTH